MFCLNKKQNYRRWWVVNCLEKMDTVRNGYSWMKNLSQINYQELFAKFSKNFKKSHYQRTARFCI